MHVVIIGNSAAGLSALESYRKYDRNSPVSLISQESSPAYSKVLLPYFLNRRISYQNLFIRSNHYYRDLFVDTYFNQRVVSVEPEDQVVILDNGKIVPYSHLLIATGATPVTPPVEGLEGPDVYYLWTLNDCRRIDSALIPGKRVLVVGSGFVALQAAWSASQRGLHVIVFELMPRIMPQSLDNYGAEILAHKIKDDGIELHVNVLTKRIARNPDGTMAIYAEGHKPVIVDLILVGTGVRPQDEIFPQSNLIKHGIPVDERMATSVPGIFAAGDVVQGPTCFGEKHVPQRFWPTAVEQGRIAGANMAGQTRVYEGSLNMNVTYMFGVSIASIGEFQEDSESIKYYSNNDSTYIKVILEEGIPRGGIIVGDAKYLPLFGCLRPLIKYKKKVKNDLFNPCGDLIRELRLVY